jgi:hypothetical protein
MFKKAVQRGRLSARTQAGSERGGEVYSLPYVEPLSDARTKLAGFFSILLRLRSWIVGHPRRLVIAGLFCGQCR